MVKKLVLMTFINLLTSTVHMHMGTKVVEFNIIHKQTYKA